MVVRLTDKHILSIKPAAGERVEVYDLQEPGLLLRVAEGGNRSWFFRYRVPDGRQPRFKLGTYPATGVAEARRKAQEARRLVEAGADPAALERKAQAAAKAQEIRTYDDLVEAYFVASEMGSYRPRGRPKRTSTIMMERRLYERHIRKPLARTPVVEIGRADVKTLTRGLLARGITTQANHVQAFIRQTFSYAVEEELVAFNPIMHMTSPAPKKARDRVLDDRELWLLWRALKDPSDLTDRNGHKVTLSVGLSIALRLAALLLQRRGEIAGMRLADLDLRQGIWVLPGDFVKNGRPHVVPLPPAAVDLVQQAIAARDQMDSPYVFPSPRDRFEPVHPDALTRAMGRLIKALGIPLAGPHDLRRTGATMLASERGDVPPFLVSQVLNHTTDGGGGSMTTRRHYNLHLYAKEKRQALTVWEALLLEIVGKREPVGSVTPLLAFG